MLKNIRKYKNILKKIGAEWRLKWIWDGNGDRDEGGDNSLTHPLTKVRNFYLHYIL